MIRSLCVLIALALCVPAFAGTVFDTTTSWDDSSFVSPLGGGDATSTYGQTFVAPTDNVLNSFTVYVDPTGNTIAFHPFVWEWAGPLLGNGGQATGSALYFGPEMTISGSGFQPVTVNTGGVSLTPGGEYLLGLTLDSAEYATSGSGNWGLILFNHVANNGGGGFVFYNNGGDLSRLNTTQWDTFDDFGDSAFSASFSAGSVPEPATAGLVGCAVLVLALRRRWNRA